MTSEPLSSSWTPDECVLEFFFFECKNLVKFVCISQAEVRQIPWVMFGQKKLRYGEDGVRGSNHSPPKLLLISTLTAILDRPQTVVCAVKGNVRFHQERLLDISRGNIMFLLERLTNKYEQFMTVAFTFCNERHTF